MLFTCLVLAIKKNEFCGISVDIWWNYTSSQNREVLLFNFWSGDLFEKCSLSRVKYFLYAQFQFLALRYAHLRASDTSSALLLAWEAISTYQQGHGQVSKVNKGCAKCESHSNWEERKWAILPRIFCHVDGWRQQRPVRSSQHDLKRGRNKNSNTAALALLTALALN